MRWSKIRELVKAHRVSEATPGEQMSMAYGIRQIAIQRGVEIALALSTTKHINALEVGCMFNRNEGMSTLSMARFAKKQAGNVRFVSIEYNSAHIELAKQIIVEADSSLLHHVDFLLGHSLQMLPEALSRLDSVHFAFLDGGAHPEVCLQEFELVTEHLTSTGLILIDDVQSIPPSVAYPPRRVFGKGTLILPYLTIIEYLRQRALYISRNNEFGTGTEGVPSSRLVEWTLSMDFEKCFADLNYRILSKGRHKMLIVAKQQPLERYLDKLDNTIEVI